MIACVTFETVMITDPIKFYESHIVHLIHYTRDATDERYKVYLRFYEQVCKTIREMKLGIEIIEHVAKITDFTTMLRTILEIMEKEEERDERSDIYVNVSAGSSEYVAAASIASMMKPRTIPFSVPTKDYTVEDVKGVFFIEDTPVGLTKTTREPKRMPKYKIDIPSENIVKGLKILSDLNDSDTVPKGSEVIANLKKQGIWRKSAPVYPEEEKHKQGRSDSVYYQRDFINKWLENGWVYKNKYEKRYFLTEDGRTALRTFYHWE
jgi:hypothetical protein